MTAIAEHKMVKRKMSGDVIMRQFNSWEPKQQVGSKWGRDMDFFNYYKLGGKYYWLSTRFELQRCDTSWDNGFILLVFENWEHYTIYIIVCSAGYYVNLD